MDLLFVLVGIACAIASISLNPTPEHSEMSALNLIGPTVAHATSTSAAWTFQPDASVADPNALDTPQSWRCRIIADTDVFIHIDTTDVDATASDFLLPAKATMQNVFVVPPGGFVSILAASSAGDAWVTRVKHG